MLPRQHLSKTCLHLYLCCCFWMFHSQTSRPFRCYPACVHEEDCRPSLASNLAPQDMLASDRWLSLTSRLTSQDVLTSDHWLSLSSQSPLKKCLQVHCDFHSQVSHLSRRACKCTATFTLKSVTSQDVLASALRLSLLVKSPLETCLQVHHWLLLLSHLAAVIVLFGTGLQLRHISLFMAQTSCSCVPDTASWCHRFYA